MRILQVDLDNVKSYRRANITFAPGVNAICGHNGAGKSTLLEAIGFVLFDFLAVKHNDFVREGEKTATITVYIADTDGRVYHVVRRCGGSSQYYVHDPELGQKLTESKAETVTWLREFLGVNPAMDLTTLFRDAVGVPQGLLTAPFLETASRRKDVFNPLLRVDEYERVWDALREPRRRLEQQITAKEKAIAGLEAQVETLPELREQLAGLVDEIARSVQRQTGAQSELDAVTERKTHLEDLKAQLDASEKQVAQVEADLRTVAARRDDAQAALERSQEARAVVTETQAAHRAYLDAEARLAALDEERDARDRARGELQACVHAQDLARQEAARLEQQLAGVAAAEARMEALKPQVQAQADLEAGLDAARRDVERLRAAEETLAREQQRLAQQESRLETLQAQLKERAALESGAQAARADLEAHAAQREKLATQLATQQSELKVVAERAQQAARQLAAAQTALERAQQRLADLEVKRAEVQRGLETLAEVEAQVAALRAEIAALDEEDRARTAQLAAAQSGQEQLHTQIVVLAGSDAADCPVCGAPLSPEHREDLLARNRARVAELDALIAEVEARQEAAAKDRRSRERALRKAEKQIQSLPRPSDAEELAAQLAAQQEAVAGSDRELDAAQAGVAEREVQQAALEAALAETQPQVEAAEAARDAAQATVRDLETRLKALPRASEAEELAEQIATQRQTVANNEQAALALRGAPDDVTRLEAELAALGDPRRDHQRAADVAAQRAAVTESHIANAARLADLAAQREALEAQVTLHDGLDERLAAARDARETHAPDHRRYLQHEREAAALDERRSAQEALAEETQTAEAQCDDRVAARDALARQYDASTYETLVAQHGALREELAGIQAGLHHRREQQTEKQAGIERMEARGLELDAARVERNELAADQSLLENLRQVLRDAGPEITRMLVDLISLRADRLYADIMQSYGGKNPPAHLRWTAEYDIVLTSEGRERTFQQLSGGEQMASALAVQLALLREVSSVDVAFFDEPTANLDRDRRANLARQVLNIQGFGQLFVISHDDTFEQDTDFVVRIEKTDGESHVVA